MTSEEKKVYMLLKSVIYHYHGLDELEKQDLENSAQTLDAAQISQGLECRERASRIGTKVIQFKIQDLKFKNWCSKHEV